MKIFLGLIYIILVSFIYYIDRVIVAFLFWLKTYNLKTWLKNRNNIVYSIIRIFFITLLFLLIKYLI